MERMNDQLSENELNLLQQEQEMLAAFRRGCESGAELRRADLWFNRAAGFMVGAAAAALFCAMMTAWAR